MFPRRCVFNGYDSGGCAGWLLRYFNAAGLLSDPGWLWVCGGLVFLLFGDVLAELEFGSGECHGGGAGGPPGVSL